MAFDGFILKSVIQELSSCLLTGKITKVYQPLPEEIVLGVYCGGTNYALSCNVSSSYSLHLTTTSKPNPLVAPSFCMLLRKYLIGSKIKNITMAGLERIATIELENYNELNDLVTYQLVIELMGKHSNIILVNQENMIIDSLKHLTTFSGSLRNILPNETYQLPELNKSDLSTISINSDFYDTISNDAKSSSLSECFCNHFSGTSKTLINYSITQLAINEDLTFENFKTLLTYLQGLLTKIQNQQVTCLLLENDYVLSPSSELSTHLNVNFFLDDYYAKKEQEEEFIQYRNGLLSFIAKKLKKIAKKSDEVTKKVQECSKMQDYQLYGELLTNNLYRLKEDHIDHIVLDNYYQQNQPITIPLNISLSPSDNAKKYFKKYHKLKNTISIVTVQKEELEKEIDYLESIVYELQIAKNIAELDRIYQEMEENNLFSRKVPVKQGNKSFKIKSRTNNRQKVTNKKQNDFLSYQINGFTVLVGKNNQENDYLTLKIAKENDIWFHVKDLQGSHVILVVNQKEPSQETINQVAAISAHYSKAKQSSNIPVDYTLVKYVKKPAKAKPGMVIYTNYQTVNVQPANL